jgi:membrane fusion protein (multidrug efflux system)
VAQAGQQEVKMRQQQIATYQAQADQAKSALDAAQVTLDDCNIYAPSDGVVVKKNANIGEAMQPGSTIFTITRGTNVWVEANFKETQLDGVKVGQPAEVEIDAYPGVTFRGHVTVIDRASGNAMALLPTDNATGNFTKVVQRVPVRIALDNPAPPGNANKDATEEQINSLSQGLSVNATVDLKTD